MTSAIITWLETELAKLKESAAPVVATVESDAQTLEKWVVTNGYPLIMQDALAAVTGMLAGTPWATLMAQLIATAETQGKTLEAGAADVALNLAKAQLVVAGTVAPVTPAPAAV